MIRQKQTILISFSLFLSGNIEFFDEFIFLAPFDRKKMMTHTSPEYDF